MYKYYAPQAAALVATIFEDSLSHGRGKMELKTVVWKGVDGRDSGKLYTITELPAADAERWAWRIGLSLLSADASIAETLIEEGVLGLLKIGFLQIAKLEPEKAVDWTNELLQSCVSIHPDKQRPAVSIPWNDEGAAEVATRFKLKMEIMRLHTGFFTNATNAS